MAFQDLFAEVHGRCPKIPIQFCKTIVNRGWRDVRRKNLWSFQLFETNWVTANLIGSQTSNATLSCNVTQGNNQVVFNAAANNNIANIGNGPFPPAVTHQQFRTGISTIYDIFAYNNATATATLDRPYTDVSANNTAFTIGSYYFAVPYSDFVRWIVVADMVDFQVLDQNRTREWIARQDPQLTQYFWPTHVVPWDNDINANSNTNGFYRYMLWGLPQSMRTYQCLGIREGADLVNPGDTLPFVIGDDVVLAIAMKYAYEFMMSSGGDIPRGQGVDWRFLIGETMAEYKRLYAEYRRRDRERVDSWFTVRRPAGFTYSTPYYNSLTGTSWPGLPWG